MVIVNKELVGESDGVEFIVPDLPIGEFFERTISDLLKMRGDGLWMVRVFFFITLVGNFIFLD